jgi:uncharacterized protein YndB with AHSA1/START domain
VSDDDVLVVRRVIPASREEVFDAWLDAENMAEWMRPGDTFEAKVELDPRVGGKFHILMIHGRDDHDHWGEYLEIDRPSRLSFTWISKATSNLPTIVTIELRDVEGGTELTLTHRGLPDAKIDDHRNGWGAILRKFGESLG